MAGDRMKPCPRCNGQMLDERYLPELYCLQCGHREPIGIELFWPVERKRKEATRRFEIK